MHMGATLYCLGEIKSAVNSCLIKCLKPAQEEYKFACVKVEPGAFTAASIGIVIKKEPYLSSTSEDAKFSASSSSTTTQSAPNCQNRHKFSGVPKRWIQNQNNSLAFCKRRHLSFGVYLSSFCIKCVCEQHINFIQNVDVYTPKARCLFYKKLRCSFGFDSM